MTAVAAVLSSPVGKGARVRLRRLASGVGLRRSGAGEVECGEVVAGEAPGLVAVECGDGTWSLRDLSPATRWPVVWVEADGARHDGDGLRLVVSAIEARVVRGGVPVGAPMLWPAVRRSGQSLSVTSGGRTWTAERARRKGCGACGGRR